MTVTVAFDNSGNLARNGAFFGWWIYVRANRIEILLEGREADFGPNGAADKFTGIFCGAGHACVFLKEIVYVIRAAGSAVCVARLRENDNRRGTYLATKGPAESES